MEQTLWPHSTSPCHLHAHTMTLGSSWPTFTCHVAIHLFFPNVCPRFTYYPAGIVSVPALSACASHSRLLTTWGFATWRILPMHVHEKVGRCSWVRHFRSNIIFFLLARLLLGHSIINFAWIWNLHQSPFRGMTCVHATIPLDSTTPKYSASWFSPTITVDFLSA